MTADKDLKKIIIEFVDMLLPELTPYEVAMYLYLLRNSYMKGAGLKIRIGKRSIASSFVKGVRGERVNYSHVTEVLKSLEKKNCLKVGDTTREGTLYEIMLPAEIPSVREKLKSVQVEQEDDDWFNDAEKRRELFEKDRWTCQYCGEKVSIKNATLDHYVPQWKGGKHTKENLKTCCLLCNGIKSGKSYEDAATFLLKSIQERRSKSNP